MNKFISTLFFIVLLPCLNLVAQNEVTLTGMLTTKSGKAIPEVVIYAGSQYVVSEKNGEFKLEIVKNKPYLLSFQGINIVPFQQEVTLLNDSSIQFIGVKKAIELDEVTINANSDPFGVRKLRPTEDGGLYEGKKTEVINLKKLVGNKATNNPRQAFRKIPGLTIWEAIMVVYN